jgi:predicted DNA-binding ribbon-helix-helix protein
MSAKAVKLSAVVRRTVRISGRSTSLTLEDPFWEALQEIAEAKGMTRANLVSAINERRSYANLSSGVRLFVLAYYQGLGRRKPTCAS